jgi:hypothetical protein
MNEPYLILDASGGWLVNFVMWDGNTETWQPPEGTIARLAADVDISSLPPSPEESHDNSL